jgi:hypothetical protein
MYTPLLHVPYLLFPFVLGWTDGFLTVLTATVVFLGTLNALRNVVLKAKTGQRGVKKKMLRYLTLSIVAPMIAMIFGVITLLSALALILAVIGTGYGLKKIGMFLLGWVPKKFAEIRHFWWKFFKILVTKEA